MSLTSFAVAVPAITGLRARLKAVPGAVGFVTRLRRWKRASRTLYLRRRYPAGGFLQCNDISVFCNFDDESYAWYDGVSRVLAFDQRLIAAVLDQSPGNVAFDIGAHFGFFAAYLAGLTPPQAHRPWRVLALEPDAAHFRCLQQTILRCGSGDRVTLSQVAIAECDKRLTLFRSGASCLHSYAEPGSLPVGRVEARSLDSLVATHLAPDDRLAFIKIDVDGAEPLLFAGGKRTIAAHKPTVLMEFAPTHLRAAGTDPGDLFVTLCRQYHVYWILYRERCVRRVTESDLLEIQERTADGIADLILANMPLKLPTLDV